MEIAVVQLTRQELYDVIWAVSVAGAAKQYDIPYPQMLKQAKAADIPIPPSGYWTKLQFGKPTEKIPLPGSADEMIQLTKEVSPAKPAKSSFIAAPVAAASSAKDEAPSSVEAAAAKSASPIADQTPETIVRCGQTYNVYDRETLYQEVWAAPVTEVAKKYKVSDVAIHKICKSLDIPTPGLGYWAKRRAGKPVTKEPLPKSSNTEKKKGLQTGRAPAPPADKIVALSFLDAEDRTAVLAVATQILLPDGNARMHKKIIAHRKVIEQWKKERNSRGWNPRNKAAIPYLADSIAKESIPRACRIIDALIKAMEPLGCILSADLAFEVNGESVRLTFAEAKDKLEHLPTKEENLRILEYEEDRKQYSWAKKPQIPKYDHVYNGRLSLYVGSQKTFRDCRSYVLEDRLGDIMIEIYNEAESLRQQRLAREEAERIRQEEARRKEELRKRYNTEVDRTLALSNLAEDYATACKIRAYIASVEKSNQQEDLSEWIKWANEKADWFDPTIAKEDEFFGRRNHEKNSEEKKLRYRGYGW